MREPADDADGDGADNLLEFAFDSSPRDGGAIGGPTPVPDGITYPRRRTSPLTYRVEVSTDLATWHYNGDGSGQSWTNEGAVVPIDGEMDLVEIEPGAALVGATELFYRIRVSSSEALLAPVTSSLRQTKAIRKKVRRR